jgi:cation diffusion facilitator family transporter
MSDHEPVAPVAPLLGILVMDAVIERIPGDAGNPASFPFPVLLRTVRGATLKRLIAERDPALLGPFIEAGRDLVRQGVKAVTTTCGFMVLFQDELARQLPVPVFTSSLLQLPFIERTLGPAGRVGVLTADSSHLTAEHLRRAGGDPGRIAICGLENQPAFREAIFGGTGRIDPAGVEAEVVRQAERLVAADARIAAILFECANLPPYAAAVQKAVGLPVYDFSTMVCHVHAALVRGEFAAGTPLPHGERRPSAVEEDVFAGALAVARHFIRQRLEPLPGQDPGADEILPLALGGGGGGKLHQLGGDFDAFHHVPPGWVYLPAAWLYSMGVVAHGIHAPRGPDQNRGDPMHRHTLNRWRHEHRFHLEHAHGERATRRVIALTLAMMVIEIAAGLAFGSMALLADGWHMGTHAVALGITALAYYYARRHADNPRFSFGTGKVGELGGFASAVVLAVVALIMAVESVLRLIEPQPIRFNQAIAVAAAGLVVNVVSALMLQEKHGHDDHGHEAGVAAVSTHGRDHNLRAAYLHVLADALTSLLAIFALLTGKALGWVWMDPLMGIAGALIITRWAWGLLGDTSRILLDRDVDPRLVAEITSCIEAEADNRVSDIHVWRVGARSLAAIVSVVTHQPRSPEHYKNLLAGFGEIAHVTVEVNGCAGESCAQPAGDRRE